MHEQLFPALTERYKDQIHIVYRDFPLDQHPWAMRAAIDTNCVGAQSPTGYWNLVDYIHAHAAEMGGEEKSLAKANDTLDSLARDEGKRQKLNADASECVHRQTGRYGDQGFDEAGRIAGRGLDAGALYQWRKDGRGSAAGVCISYDR